MLGIIAAGVSVTVVRTCVRKYRNKKQQERSQELRRLRSARSIVVSECTVNLLVRAVSVAKIQAHLQAIMCLAAVICNEAVLRAVTQQDAKRQVKELLKEHLDNLVALAEQEADKELEQELPCEPPVEELDSDEDSDDWSPCASVKCGRALPALKMHLLKAGSDSIPNKGSDNDSGSGRSASSASLPSASGKVVDDFELDSPGDDKENTSPASPKSLTELGGSMLHDSKLPACEDAKKGVPTAHLAKREEIPFQSFMMDQPSATSLRESDRDSDEDSDGWSSCASVPWGRTMPGLKLDLPTRDSVPSPLTQVTQVVERIESLFGRLQHDPSDMCICKAEEEMGALHKMLLQDGSTTLMKSVLANLSSKGEHYVCLLRFIARNFSSTAYHSRTPLFQAPFRVVYGCQNHAGEVVAMKMADLETKGANIFSRVVAYNEARIMRKLEGVPGMCRLLDYGMDQEHAHLVMPKYKGSLRQWRLEQPNITSRLSLELFLQAVNCVKALHAEEIIHFDVKCDNFLLEGSSGQPNNMELPFTLVLADFGSAMDVSSCQDKFTMRARGTECVQPPEMLLMGRRGQDKASGCTGSADVWALGCLLYELVTGAMLFNSDVFAKFFCLLTHEGREVHLPADVLEPIAHLPQIKELLHFILVRDPVQRPRVDQVADRVQVVLDAYGDDATSTEAASNTSKAAAGKWPQLPLPTTKAVNSPGPTYTRPALPARPKAAQVPTAQPSQAEATNVGQEHTVAGMPAIIEPAAPAPAVVSTSGMLGDNNVLSHATKQSPARSTKKQSWMKILSKKMVVAGAAVGTGLFLLFCRR